MPPGRKSITVSNKFATQTTGQLSPSKVTYECGSVVWCKYKKYPYWPAIVWDVVVRPTRTSYEVLFFGTFSLGQSVDRKWLEPFEGVAEFKKRIAELKASEVLIKNKASQYDMNITIANLESFQEAVKQATKVIKCSNYSARLQLADNMRKGVTCDFFQLEFEDHNEEDDDEVENHDETNSNPMEDSSLSSMSTIQNDQQFIQTMINQGKKKRRLEEDVNSSNCRMHRVTVKAEPEQVIQPLTNTLPSILLRNSTDQPIVMCSNFVCHSLSPTEETFILDAIARAGSDCTFSHAKQIAEQTYFNIICINNSNRSLPVSELWFYLFFYLHFEQLFSTHPHWLNDLEQAKINETYLYEQQQQIIRLMKTYKK